jgi:SSS family solute:Na+ symporter
MATMTLITIGALLTYAVLCLLIGFLPGVRTRLDVGDYYVADRSFSFGVLFFCFTASVYSGLVSTGTMGVVLKGGVAVFFMSTYIIFGYALFYLCGPRIWRWGKQYGYVTQGDLLYDRYQSNAVRVMASTVGFICLLPYIATGIIAVAYVLEIGTAGLLPFWLGALIMYGVISIYVYTGGIRAVTWTNVVQGVLLYFGTIIGAIFIISNYFPDGGVIEAVKKVKPQMLYYGDHTFLKPEYYFSMGIVCVLAGYTCWPHLYNRFYMARDVRQLKLTALLGPFTAVIMFGGALACVLPLIAAAPRVYANPDTVFVLEMFATAPPWLFALIALTVISGAMSTVDGQVHIAGGILSRDLIQKGYFRKDVCSREDDIKYVRLGKNIMVLVTFISYLLALFRPPLMWTLLLVATGWLAQLVPAIFGALFWRRATAPAALAGMTTGLVVTAYCTFIWPSPFGYNGAFWGLVLNAAVYVAVALNTRAPSDEVLERFFGKAAKASGQSVEIKA